MSRLDVCVVHSLLGLVLLSCGAGRTGLFVTRSGNRAQSDGGTDSRRGADSGHLPADDAECPPRTRWCGSGQGAGCYSLEDDAMNCGACGVVCAPGTSCVGGACRQRECTGPLSFEKLAEYPQTLTTNTTSGYQGADIDRDGRLDLLEYALYDDARELAIWLGQGDGTFAVSTRYPTVGGFDTPALSGYAAVGDFNEDGLADLVVTKLEDRSLVEVRPGLPGGGLGGHPGIPFPRLSTADFDGDGHLDVVTAAASPDKAHAQILTLRGRGDGSLAGPTRYTIPDGVASSPVELQDWDGDGILDVLVSSVLLHILYGRGDGTFAEAQRCPVGAGAGQFLFADLNQDGKLDLMWSMWPDQRLATILSQGECKFTPRTDHAFSFQPGAFAMGDLDGDGRSDLLVTGYSDSPLGMVRTWTATLLMGNGNGTFTRQPDLAIDATETGMVLIADVNDDGRLDVILTGNRGIVVYGNTCAP